MSKTSKIVRGIIAGIMVALCAYAIIMLVECIPDILAGGWGGLAVIVLLYYFIFGIPIALADIIYQIVMIVKKKFWIISFITSVLLILSWLSLWIVPVITLAIIQKF